MSAIKIGCAQVSTIEQDLPAQRNALTALGIEEEHIYVDHGMTGSNGARPGLRKAIAAVRRGDTLVVTKLDRLARSLPDARDLADELTKKGVSLSLGGSVHDPSDRSAGSCSTCSVSSPSSKLTSFVYAPGKEWPWPEPTAGCGASSPSSHRHSANTFSRPTTTPIHALAQAS